MPLARANGPKFFAHAADDVHPLAGHCTNKEAFVRATFSRLAAIMREPLRLILENVVGGGHEDQAVVEFRAIACKNGTQLDYGADKMLIRTPELDLDNRYAWALKFNRERKIVRVHAYLDSAFRSRIKSI